MAVCIMMTDHQTHTNDNNAWFVCVHMLNEYMTKSTESTVPTCMSISHPCGNTKVTESVRLSVCVHYFKTEYIHQHWVNVI